jgi:hypothetical protein
MQKFIVGINPRTGSTIYAMRLDAAIPKAPSDISALVSWSSGNDVPDWSLPIQHTHQFKVFTNAPPEFKRLWCRRNYFDSSLSYFVADHTKTYHIFSHQDQVEYREKYQNTKFTVDPGLFLALVEANHGRDRDISQWQQQTHNDMIPLFYHVHAQNAQAFYNAVNLTTSKFATTWPQALPVDKYDLVENLNELLNVYCKFDSPFDVDKDATVARIEQYLKK